MTDNKKGATPCESAPQNDTSDSTRETSRETERGLYLPLAWAQLGGEVKPQKFRGKGRRQARADAIRVKRMGGAIAAELAALLVLAVVAGVLLLEVLQ